MASYETGSSEETFSVKKLYQEFGDSTSMHGIGKVISARRNWRRLLWSVLFLTSVGFTIYQLVYTLKDFYSYPVTTVVKLTHEKQAEFPGITICNLNRKRKSMIGPLLLQETSQYAETEVAPQDTRLNVRMQNDTLFHESESGHIISDMLNKCLFNRRWCSAANFTNMTSTTYGTCYTFQITDPKHQFATRPSPHNGLILQLNIQQNEYLSITSTAGVKVMVHPKDEYPFPEDGGILAHPGAVTSIGIKKKIANRLPTPYSNCVGAQGQESTQRNLFSDEIYTKNTCMKSCYQLKLYQMCHCCDVDLPCDYDKMVNAVSTTNKADGTVPFCNTTENLECKSTVEDRFLKSEFDCDERCPPACRLISFDTLVSTALWPSDSRLEALSQGVIGADLHNQSDNSSLERFIRSNFLRLEIYLDSLETVEFVTEAKYNWNYLLGTIGGLLGLWLGFSLLTAIEVVELLFELVFYYSRRQCITKLNIQTEMN